MDVNESGVEAYKLGAIPAYDMSMEATTVKLGWLLGEGKATRYEDMRRQMTTAFRDEIRPMRI